MTQGAIQALVGGLLLGLTYAAAGYLMSRKALDSPKRFVHWVVGGTVARMVLALATVVVVIIVLPVQRTVFLATFLLIFFAALAAEITLLHRKP